MGYTAPRSGGAVNYAVDAATTAQGTSNPVCAPSELATPSNIDAAAGGEITAPTLNFSGCD